MKPFGDLDESGDAVPEMIDGQWWWVRKTTTGAIIPLRKVSRKEGEMIVKFCEAGIERAERERGWAE